MTKLEKYEGFLDSLPDSILFHILSFLPTRDAVWTSILSPRWRYLFTSSIFEFDFRDCLGHSPVPKEHINNFKKFVDRLFFNPKHLRLESFRVNNKGVNDSLSNDFLTLYNWLCAALWHGVKEIDVNYFNRDLPVLPTLLFTCPSLVTLKLYICGWEMKLPTNVCLPNLKTLHLWGIELLDGCLFLSLISGCPVLEDLGLSNCFLDGTTELNIYSLLLKILVLDLKTWVNYRDSIDFDCVFVIDAPSLVHFQYACLAGKQYTLRNMERLEKADIELFHFDDADCEQSATLLQRGICNNPCEDRTVSVTWIVEFLHCAPNLKTFTLDLADADRVFESPLEEVPSCLLYHLKEISILSFMGDTHMFEIVSYFLNHVLVLEKLKSECRSSIIEKLSSLPKNSKKCEIEFL
ncbi:hypothetical protein like AT5G56420 [Hibiscus trionum]|uniref:F-box domain-containing protein n=1 Tax=Hibiscus trionum TaxID=183268 RepID=A0A9W7M4B6_HIBTR|nr:hypothetical protein like AT5G56420 [Hibiscus trionum]